jgi:Gram-negative bacterial TonB protein C-terminal
MGKEPVKSLRALGTATLMMMCASAVHADDWARMSPGVTARVDVDADGRIVAVEPLGTLLGAELSDAVRQAVSRWTFVPAEHDGKSAPARTYVNLDIERQKDGDKYNVRFRYRSNGPTYTAGIDKVVVPYPQQMISHRREARLIFTARVMPDGSLRDIALDGAQTTAGSEATPFVEACKRAIGKWRVQPETVGGEAVATRVLIPLNFSLKAFNGYGQAVSTPHGELLPASDSPAPIGEENTYPGNLIALDSPLKPKDTAL